MKRKGKRKRFWAVFLAVIMMFSVMSESVITVQAASNSVTVATQKKLNGALKKKSVTSINVKTKKKSTFSVKSKKYKAKALSVNGSKITFKNKGVFKEINIKNVKSFIENASGNTLNVTDSKATIEVGKSAKKTSVNLNRKNARITLKVNGSVSSVKVTEKTSLSVTGKPKSKLKLTNEAVGSKLNINTSSKVSVALKKNASVTIGKSVKGATITLAKGVTGTIVNKSKKSITVKRTGGTSVVVKAGKKKSVTNKADNTSKPDVPIEVFTISFETNGGSAVENQIVEKGKKLLKPEEPTWDGFQFKGWYYDSSFKHAYDFEATVSKSFTLYAKWKVIDDSDVNHKVTFVLNDESDGAYELQTVENNGYISKPATDPTRAGYEFTGWYDDETLTSEFDFSSPVMGDVTIYAGWGNPEGEDGLYASEGGDETIYSVSSLTVEDGAVKSTVNANESSILVVSFYDGTGYFGEDSTWSVDNAENYGNLATYTPDYCEETMISLDIGSNIQLPDYYIVTATLYDSEDLSTLCEPLICADYTEENAQFEALTVDDFEEETVLNFDNQSDNNFGVLAEDIIEIFCDDEKNILSEETAEVETKDGAVVRQSTYTFANPDETVQELQVGNKIVIYNNGEAVNVLAVGEIMKNEDGSIAVKESMDTDLTDFYTVLKVELTTQDPEGEIQSESVSDSELSTQAEIIDAEVSPSVSLKPSLEWKISNHASLKGELNGTAKLTFKIKYDAKLFRKDYFECTVKSTLSGTFKIELEGKLDNSEAVKKKLDGVKVPFKTPIIGLDAYTAVTFPTEIAFSGAVSFTFEYTMDSGFSYNTNSGRKDIDKKSYSVDFKGDAKFEVKTGPKFTVGVTFMKDKLDANIDAQIGIKVSAELSVTQDDGIATNVDSRHSCYTCLSGTARWFGTAGVKLKYKIVKDVLEGTPFDVTILNVEGYIHGGGFYFSILNAEESIFGGKRKLGWGSCPNESYRTIIETYDENGEEITGASVTITKNNGDVAKSGASQLKAYLYDGVYKVSGKINDKSVSNSFVINGNAKTVKLTANSNSTTKIIGYVRDAETQNWLGDATIQFKKGTMTIATAKSGSDGSFTEELPADSYEVVISKEGYVTAKTNQTIVENETRYMETIDLVPGSDKGKGGFSGYITDALTGNAVGNVKLDVREGANSPDTNDILISLTTNSSGYYEYNPDSFFGINRGLPSGQYTITASKGGYITTSFNIIVKEDEVVENQNGTISPELDEDEFRIVLRWGSNPSDLDSHYNAIGEEDHVYYSRKSGTTANLDVDDTSSYGPETITVTGFTSLSKGFVYSVHDYTNKSSESSMALANSGAYVTIYHADESPVIFHVPVGHTGTVWNVFRVDTSGNIEALNIFDNCSSPENVGSGLTEY